MARACTLAKYRSLKVDCGIEQVGESEYNERRRDCEDGPPRKKDEDLQKKEEVKSTGRRVRLMAGINVIFRNALLSVGEH